jgi:hypothetical protein
MSQRKIDNDKDNDGTKTATTQFFGAVSGDQETEKFVHCINAF